MKLDGQGGYKGQGLEQEYQDILKEAFQDAFPRIVGLTVQERLLTTERERKKALRILKKLLEALGRKWKRYVVDETVGAVKTFRKMKFHQLLDPAILVSKPKFNELL